MTIGWREKFTIPTGGIFSFALGLVLVIVWMIGCKESPSSSVAIKLSDDSHLPVNAIPSDKNSNHWIDSRRCASDGGIAIAGPFVLRAKNKPAFIWQTTSFSNSNLNSHVPYVIVIENTNSMQMLTNFSIGSPPWSADVFCTGFFQGSGFSGRFCHAYKVTNNEELLLSRDSPMKIQEIFSLDTTDGEKDFDLQKGRVFLVRNGKVNKRFKVVQLDIDMPSKETSYSPNSMGGTAEKCYRDFEEWWSKRKGSKGVSLPKTRSVKLGKKN